MVIILIVWTFCLLLSVLWGLAALQLPSAFSAKHEPTEDVHSLPILSMVGLVALGALSSFITSCGLNTFDTFAVVLVLSFGLLFLYKKAYPSQLATGAKQLAQYHPLAWLFIAAYGLAFLITAAGPSEIGDEGGYHLPILVMLEQVGLVRGAGNLNHHIPLCSNWHVLNSVLGFGWVQRVPGYGFYDLTGYISVLFVFWCAGYAHKLAKAPTLVRHHYVALVAICLPMLIIKSPISAPTNDIPAWIFTWAGCVFFLDNKTDYYREAWLVPVFLLGGLIGIKITHAAMLLVPAILLLYGLADKRYKEVAWAVAILAFLNIPSVLRSIELSGYILFPVLGKQNWLQVPWITPEWWALNANNPAHYGLPVEISKTSWAWVHFWFTQYYKPMEAALMGLCAASALYVSVVGLLHIGKRRLQPLEIVYSAVLVSLAILFFAGSPEPRYGLGFVGIGAFAFAFYTIAELPMSRYFGLAIISVAVMYGGIKLFKSVQGSFDPAFLVSPSRVQANFNQVTIKGNIYYEPRSCQGYTNPTQRTDCDCWNAPFPCYENLSKLPPLLGTTPAQGFKTRVSD
jgi:hypothetical protein